MHSIYFFDQAGHCERTIREESTEKTLRTVISHKYTVPRIVVVENDQSILETRDGVVVFPKWEAATIRALEEYYPPKESDIIAEMRDGGHFGAMVDFVD